MSDHVYKTIKITGSSKTSIEEAIERAIARSNENLHNLRWFDIDQIRGHIVEGKVDHYQVSLNIGFTLDE